MRLKRAMSMNRLSGTVEMGSREDRQERREERRERRRARKAARQDKRKDRREGRLAKKADKLREKAENLEEKAAAPTRREARQERREERREDRQERRSERRGEPAQVRAAVAPVPRYPRRQHYPQDQGYPQDPGYRPPDAWTDDGSFPPEDEDIPPMEEGEVELEPAEPSAEGMGWSLPGRKATAAPVATRPQAAQLPAPWSAPARMGTHMRIQASAGFRAAVVELRPGLFVVAEIPAEVARSEMGFAPLIAPLMMRAASRAAARQNQAQVPTYVQQPDGSFAPAPPQPERRGLFSMFRQPQQQQAYPVQPGQPYPGQPLASLPGPVVQPQQTWSTAPTQVSQPVAMLPGPVEEPLPEAPISGPLVVAVPRIARWADPQDVAGVLAESRFRGRR